MLYTAMRQSHFAVRKPTGQMFLATCSGDDLSNSGHWNRNAVSKGPAVVVFCLDDKSEFNFLASCMKDEPEF